MTEDERNALASFLGQGVTTGTLRSYKLGWECWKAFIQSRRAQGDPYLRDVPQDSDKACVLAAFMKHRYDAGLRGKCATGHGASVRLYMKMALLPTDFCDNPIVSLARKACRLNPSELRELQQGGGRPSLAKLPVWEGLLDSLRDSLWDNRGWGWGDIDKRMVYLCCMWGYELAVRGSEATLADGAAEDHAIKAFQLIFRLKNPVLVGAESLYSVRGGTPAARGLDEENVLAIEVEASSHKMGDLAAKRNKVIGRRSEEESRFCSDLVLWGKRSQVERLDNWFTRYATQPGRKPSRKVCTRKEVANAIKEEVKKFKLDPLLFSFHSLRKASITHMSAKGVPKEQMLARGNYSASSLVMGAVYNYDSSGLGPLGSNALEGGSKPGLREVLRYGPAGH